MPYDIKRQVTQNISNYIVVDDFYIQLIKRNLYILNNNKKIDNDKLVEYNEECTRLAEKALKDARGNI